MTDNILQRFLDDKGRLTVWPSKPAHKQVALEYLTTKFERNRAYTEREVNDVLNNWHTFADWALLRRSLVNSDYLSRDKDGYEYGLVQRPTLASDADTAPTQQLKQQ